MFCFYFLNNYNFYWNYSLITRNSHWNGFVYFKKYILTYICRQHSALLICSKFHHLCHVLCFSYHSEWMQRFLLRVQWLSYFLCCKTKIMCNKHVNKDDVFVDGKKFKEVHSYVYLGQMVTKDHDQIQEMKMRIGQGWNAFCKLDNIMGDTNVPMGLKRKAFNECIFQEMIYGCETWSLSNTQLEKLVTTQRKMERIMIEVTLKDKRVQTGSGNRVMWQILSGA